MLQRHFVYRSCLVSTWSSTINWIVGSYWYFPRGSEADFGFPHLCSLTMSVLITLFSLLTQFCLVIYLFSVKVNQTNHISVVLPSSSVKIWDKSVKRLQSYQLLYDLKETNFLIWRKPYHIKVGFLQII